MLGLGFCRGCTDLLIRSWATLGHISYEDEEYVAEFLEELGADVTCDAKLTKLVHGGYDLYLDILRPPQISN